MSLTAARTENGRGGARFQTPVSDEDSTTPGMSGDPTDAFEGSRFAAAGPHFRGSAGSKTSGRDEFKTLEQACPSEYQRAQGAFKDSMIH